MHISAQTTMDTSAATGVVAKVTLSNEKVVSQGSKTTSAPNELKQVEQLLDNNEDTKRKVQQAVNSMNEMLEVNHSTSKFQYHDGLDRFYVTVVNSDTNEILKEIPVKKLLDAYYEMQKMIGMIVDEKI